MIEIISPDKRVHYRRPLSCLEQVIAEVWAAQGYSFRILENAPAYEEYFIKPIK